MEVDCIDGQTILLMYLIPLDCILKSKVLNIGKYITHSTFHKGRKWLSELIQMILIQEASSKNHALKQ